VVPYENRVIFPASFGDETTLTFYHNPQPVKLDANAFFFFFFFWLLLLLLLLLLLYLPLSRNDGPRLG
jgi:hypothetical protein